MLRLREILSLIAVSRLRSQLTFPINCSDYELEFGLGEGSPLARIYDLEGWVLLLGCGFDSNTSFHLGEYRAEYGTKEIVYRYAPITVEGHRKRKQFRDVNIREGKVGAARALLFPQRAFVHYAARWLPRNRRA